MHGGAQVHVSPPGDPSQVPYEDFQRIVSVVAGCHAARKQLGPMGEAVCQFRISFVSFYPAPARRGPVITAELNGAGGKKHIVGINYRQIGTGSESPTKEEVADALVRELAKEVRSISS